MAVNILIGDVMERLRGLPDDHFDTVVTSPPYWGLRDYGVSGQIGLEPTLGEHLSVMVAVFEEVRRVLKPTGTLWLNYGDCYATSPNGRSAADTKAAGTDDRTFRDKPFSTVGAIYAADPRDEDRRGSKSTLQGPQTLHTPGRIAAGGRLKPKDLCMVPNRLAIALQEAGWWVRSEIIWAKPNPMPESINDRPATSHEKIFLLSKSGRYHYDADAVRQGLAEASVSRLAQDVDAQEGSHRANGGAKSNGTMKAVGGARRRDSFKRDDSKRAAVHPGQNMGTHRPDRDDVAYPRGEGRNLRNYEPAPVQVWPIATRPFSEAHFATFPPELVERCLETAPKRCCTQCGKPWKRETETVLVPTAKAARRNVQDQRDVDADRQDAGSNRQRDGHIPGWANQVTTIGFTPGCSCDVAFGPATVLDPFGGAGTTALVADRMQMDCTIIELNPEYAEIARKRIARDPGSIFSRLKVA